MLPGSIASICRDGDAGRASAARSNGDSDKSSSTHCAPAIFKSLSSGDCCPADPGWWWSNCSPFSTTTIPAATATASSFSGRPPPPPPPPPPPLLPLPLPLPPLPPPEPEPGSSGCRWMPTRNRLNRERVDDARLVTDGDLLSVGERAAAAAAAGSCCWGDVGGASIPSWGICSTVLRRLKTFALTSNAFCLSLKPCMVS